METLTYSSGRASGCDSPGLLNPHKLQRVLLASGFVPSQTGGRTRSVPMFSILSVAPVTVWLLEWESWRRCIGS